MKVYTEKNIYTVSKKFDSFKFQANTPRILAIGIDLIRRSYVDKGLSKEEFINAITLEKYKEVVCSLGVLKNLTYKELRQTMDEVLQIKVVTKECLKYKTTTVEYRVFELAMDKNEFGEDLFVFKLNPELYELHTNIRDNFFRFSIQEIERMNNVNTVNLYMKLQSFEGIYETINRILVGEVEFVSILGSRDKRVLDRAIASILDSTDGRVDVKYSKYKNGVTAFNVLKCKKLPIFQ